MTEYKSYKWITTDVNTKGKTIDVHNVNQVFGSVAKNPCNIISIFGRARQGKSFLMNCLAGERDIFRISNEKESCTQGIDISNKWLSLNDFSKIDGGKATTSRLPDMKVGFVDAEGQGDKDISYDANLICPILLASKCAIFNWKGDLQKDHILSTLGIMTRAATNVASDSNSSSESNGTRKKFGHLHIIFRDWQSVGSDENSTFNALFGIEGTVEGSTRDQIRSDVLESFESIRVWLFDAPSDYVQDLKKKLTIDKTSLAFRGQIRALRAALSTQLREPTLFAGQPLVGKAYNTMIGLVAESLNRGEVVLPSSAYLSMMRMEVEKIKQDYEVELRAGMESLLVDIDQNVNVSGSAGTAAHYPSELNALRLLGDLFNRISEKYEEEIQRTIGSLTSQLSGQILADYPAQLERINNGLRDHFVSAYQRQFAKWLLTARQRAERSLSNACEKLAATLPLIEQELEEALQSIFQQAVVIVGGTAVYGQQEEVKDCEEVLRRHFSALSGQAKQQNAALLAAARQKLDALLNEAKSAMAHTISDTVRHLNETEQSGYELSKLEKALNARYFELNAQLVEKCGQSLHTKDLVSEFKTACGEMRNSMVAEYNRAKAKSFSDSLQFTRAIAEEQLLNETDVEFDRDVHTEYWLMAKFNSVNKTVKARVLSTVAGWKDVSFNGFEQEVDDILDAAAMTVSQQVLGEWEELIAEEDRAAQEAQDAAAAEAEAEAAELARQQQEEEEAEAIRQAESRRQEVEDDDDEDVYNKSNRVRTATAAPAVGSKEQREKAAAWAAANFGTKGKKCVGDKKKTDKPAVVRKTVEQQRADAAEFAKKHFGESILEKSPTKRSPQKTSRSAAEAKEQEEAYESVEMEVEVSGSGAKKRKLDSHSSSLSTTTQNQQPASNTRVSGIFATAASWFTGGASGASSSSSATASEPHQEQQHKVTPKKEPVAAAPSPLPSNPVVSHINPATGKPLTALQIAKAEAKRAEEARVASMVTTKKTKK